MGRSKRKPSKQLLLVPLLARGLIVRARAPRALPPPSSLEWSTFSGWPSSSTDVQCPPCGHQEPHRGHSPSFGLCHRRRSALSFSLSLSRPSSKRHRPTRERGRKNAETLSHHSNLSLSLSLVPASTMPSVPYATECRSRCCRRRLGSARLATAWTINSLASQTSPPVHCLMQPESITVSYLAYAM